MAFTREDLANYEKGPQKKVADNVNPFKGATAARAATGADLAAAGPLAKEGEQSRAYDSVAAPAAAADTDAPVVDEDGSLGEPAADLVGDGTSDANSDSSPDTGDSGSDAEANADLVAQPEEGADEPAPKKGSAQERIVELNDRLEGAMVFGKSMQEQLKAQIEINERLRSTSPSAPAAAPAPRPVEEKVGPMPKMTDADINYDEDKYQSRMEEWHTKSVRQEARAIVNELSGAAAAKELEASVNKKLSDHAKEHPNFQKDVLENEVLRANQLAPAAGFAVAQSEYTAELLTKFAADPDYAVRVAKMHPAQQLREVDRLIGRIEAEKALSPKKTTTNSTGTAKVPAKKSITTAPPPPRPTAAAGRTSRDVLDPTMSMEDFVRQHRGTKQSAREANRKARGLG